MNPTRSSAERVISDLYAAAGTRGIGLHILNAATGNEIDAAFENLIEHHAGALVVVGDPLFSREHPT